MPILYIDDNKADLIYVKKILQGKFQVIGVSSLEEAVVLIKTTSLQFDALLVDYKLSDTNGISAFLHIRNELKRAIPSLLITGHGDEEVAVEAISQGMENYINKETMKRESLLIKIYEAISTFDRKSLEKQKHLMLKNKAYYDQLTKLPNRNLLYDRTSQLIKEQCRKANGFTVMFIDIDGFKTVNDTHGHCVGDELLIDIARLLEEITRNSDTVARLGGDEFILLLPDLINKNKIDDLATQLLSRVSKISSISTKPVSISASIGITKYRENDKLEDIIGRADAAMYTSKNNGKSCYTLV